MFQLNPIYEIKVDDEENNEKIIQAIVEKICDQERPSLTILKGQLYFAKHYHDRGENKLWECQMINIGQWNMYV